MTTGQDKAMELVRHAQLKNGLRQIFEQTVDARVGRYIEIEHQGIIGGHYFAQASTECIDLYRDGYFIAAVMMSHAINEGVIKFIAERNKINRKKESGDTKTIEELICEFQEKKLITKDCKKASIKIWQSFRADIHHMNPTVENIDFQNLAQQNLKHLATIEKEIFGHDFNKGAIVPHQPKYWDVSKDGKAAVFLRLE